MFCIYLHIFSRYYHYSYQVPDELPDELSNINLEIVDNNVSIINSTASIANAVRDTTARLLQQVRSKGFLSVILLYIAV